MGIIIQLVLKNTTFTALTPSAGSFTLRRVQAVDILIQM